MSDTYALNRGPIRRAAGRAADHYEEHDVLARTVAEQLLPRLDFYLDKPGRILDVGAGTGRDTAWLKKRYPRAEVIALDQSAPMLHQSVRHQKLRRRFARIQAEANHLPVPDHSIDVLYANLCFQWCDDLDGLFAECNRVLTPGGFLLFSSYGPDTLRELRSAWAHVDEHAHVGRFLDMHDVGDIMLDAGLHEPLLDVDQYTLTYARPQDLLRELKALGSTNADTTRRRGLTGQQRQQDMLEAYEAMRVDGHIPATFEVITGHAWGRRADQASRAPMGGHTAAAFVDKLRRGES